MPPAPVITVTRWVFKANAAVQVRVPRPEAPGRLEERFRCHCEELRLVLGCVRVEDPVALAEYVLRDQPDWTRARIVSAMETRDESVATLPDPIPVHLGYWTTWVEGDGTLAFTDDPYGLDERHDRALRRHRGY